MKNFLIIDTATEDSSISLLIGGNLIPCPLPALQQTKNIIPTIHSLLTSNNLCLKDLDAIAICTGPGSYTGTRVGVMTAKTISYASDIPLIPFSTFDLFEKKLPYAALDAKCGRCYLKNPDGAVLLVNHQDLEKISDPVHTLNITAFNTVKLPHLKGTKKNLKALYTILVSSKKTSHDNLYIEYPTSI